jgi:hypothetical protein
MLSEYIPFKWLKESWKAVGGGSVYIRAVHIQNVNSFVEGYFTKQVLAMKYPYRARRYSCSRNIKLKRPNSGQFEAHRWVEAPTYQPKGGYYAMVERADFLEVRPIIIQEGVHV